MKKIKTSDIIAGSAMPLKSGSLEHLQNAYTETIKDLNKAYWSGFQKDAKPMALYGCENTGSGSTFTISAGALVLSNSNEVFQCDAQTVVVSVGQVLIGTITTTYYTATNADPVTFSDLTSNYVHEIRKIVWSSAASGSGDLNYSDLVYRNAFDTSRWVSIAGDLTLWSLGTGSFNAQVLIEGKKGTLFFEANNTSTAGGNNFLKITMDLPTNIKRNSYNPCYLNLAGTDEIGIVTADDATKTFTIIRQNSSFGTYTNNLDVKGQITFELA